MYRHLSTSIDGLLAMRDVDLKQVLRSVSDENGRRPTLSEFKKYLNEEKTMGHRLIRDPRCDNFDPIEGCLGHEYKEEDE
jgi:hypothetical protein